MNLIETEVVVIGSGLFGCMIAKHLRKQGFEVIIIDSRNPYGASKCSFGVYKEGWIEKIKDKVDYGMDVLLEHTTVEEVPFFNMNKNELETMSYIDCSKILNEDFTKSEVLNIIWKVDGHEVHCTDDNKTAYVIKATFVVVAAGVWTPEILIKSGFKKNIPTIDKYWGATMDIKRSIEENRIKEWAPYKQSVLVKTGDNKFVFGDGASVKNPLKEDKRVAMNSERVVQHLIDTVGSSSVLDSITSVKEGYRPYLKEGELVNRHAFGLYSATGGAKNSTVLSGYVAKKIYELIVEELES